MVRRVYLVIFVLINWLNDLKASEKIEISQNSTYFDGVALVLARGGSKGIPRKNLVTVAGISLLGRTINAIHASQMFPEIWVSTEDAEIGAEAENYGARVHSRPLDLAQDDTPSIEVVQDFIQGNPEINSVALFQCTSVFLRTRYIREACQLFQTADCVFASSQDFKLRWAFVPNGEYLKPINFDPTDRPRRQDWDGELVETGMFYFAKRELLLDGVFQNERCKVVVIENADTLELDDLEDLKLAKYLLE